MPSATQRVLIIGTGGTIAGQASTAADHVGYRAGAVGIEALVAGVPPLASHQLAFEQLAQLDSKDMDFATWRRLALRVQQAMDDSAVGGVVITHGTDTLEETAYLLHRVLRGGKPVVLTAAMRPASSLSPDGPQNLLDAVTVAQTAGACGVVVCLDGRVHRGDRVRKVHSYRVDAFDSPDGVLAWVESGAVRVLQPWLAPLAWGAERLPADTSLWPRVSVLWNAAGEDGALVPLIESLAQREGRRLGLVAAGTGNGTLSSDLERALLQAQARGVPVIRATRCAAGPVLGGGGLRNAGALSVPQARVALLLELLEA
ncbi:MAG: asparaginase [Inhella sp.]|jgi:L-asparaginase|uniref:asparaginase n=1 Tax=Inhella sp. TaxID=1921806 RepID=UPI0022C0904D|nr:asparaginase [Inhella sp.]MCZ8234344.1 asparaginase [Inhella sp.]